MKDILYYLQHFDLAEVVAKRYPKVTEKAEDLPPYVTDLAYLQENCRGLRPFYENAAKEHLQVIFTVDL